MTLEQMNRKFDSVIDNYAEEAIIAIEIAGLHIAYDPVSLEIRLGSREALLRVFFNIEAATGKNPLLASKEIWDAEILKEEKEHGA